MSKEVLINFGARVKALRQENGLTQEQLASNCGLHKNYIGMIERGERNPSLLNIHIIAKGLGKSMLELLNY
jgi:transcriptional regulator with XRE-family HTH domain